MQPATLGPLKQLPVNIRSVLLEYIEECVRCQLSAKLLCGISECAFLGWIVGISDACRDSITQEFGIVGLVRACVGTGHGDAPQRVAHPANECTVPHAEVAWVFTKEDGEGSTSQVVAYGLVRKGRFIASAQTFRALAPGRKLVLCLTDSGEYARNKKSRRVERFCRGKPPFFSRRQRFHILGRANRPIVRQNPEDAAIVLRN